jgi:ankyrin repeat protein
MDCLIKAGANVNVRNSEGATPLFCAAATGKTDAVCHVVQNGADVNICEGGFEGWSPLHVAAQYGNLEIMDCLMKAGANVNLLDSGGATPLFRAVFEVKTEAVIHLVQNGADVNICAGRVKVWSPLHSAAVYGNLEIVDCLIKAGADVNLRNSYGGTPLLCAVAIGKTEAVFHLVRNGADVNITAGGFLNTSPLFVAAQNRNQEIMDCLIEAGAPLNFLVFTGLLLLFFFSGFTALYFSLIVP